MARSRHTLALALLALTALAGVAAQGEVINLNDDTFEHDTQAGARSSHRPSSAKPSRSPLRDASLTPPLPPRLAGSGQTAGVWFVKFYAPWCGHCKALEPDWAQLAERLDGRVVVARLDGTENPVTMDRFNQHVRGFPTLLLFRDRGVYKFEGPRVVDAMETFALESYASARRHDVPPEPSAFQRWFSNFTKVLAVEIMRVHDAGAMGMRIAREDYAKVAAAWKKGGFGSAWTTATDAASASARVYGFALMMFSVTVICFIMGMALTTAPTRRPVANAKKTN